MSQVKNVSYNLTVHLSADAGPAVFPSVGKSTLPVRHEANQNRCLPLTTIVPNLGMVRTQSGESFAVADLPGLIEGASQGVGLEPTLRHIERTRVILHVTDSVQVSDYCQIL